MDTLTQAGQVGVARATKNRRRSVKERREIVEETLLAGASVSRVARRHDVNANQVFYWRKLYREGRLGGRAGTELLAVKVSDEASTKSAKRDGLATRSGSMEVELAKGTLRIAGSVDVVVLRAVLEFGIGPRWSECRSALQPDRNSQVEWSRPRKLSAERTVPHPGSSHQSHRRTATVESR